LYSLEDWFGRGYGPVLKTGGGGGGGGGGVGDDDDDDDDDDTTQFISSYEPSGYVWTMAFCSD